METADVRLLADIGFMAISAGLDQEADAIFAGVTAARPKQEAGPLGMAMVKMARNDLDGAIKILRGLAPSDAALTYLALALARQGDLVQARQLFANVINTACDASFVALAEAGLHDLKG